MALYKYSHFLAASSDDVFDAVSRPDNLAPRSGIYRCLGCGREVTSEENNPLPPQSHHQHQPHQGHIQWQMIV